MLFRAGFAVSVSDISLKLNSELSILNSSETKTKCLFQPRKSYRVTLCNVRNNSKSYGGLCSRLPQYRLLELTSSQLHWEKHSVEFIMKVIASIKAKVSSLITFITIVCANFEFENCRKIDSCRRTFARICLYAIRSSDPSLSFRQPLKSTYGQSNHWWRFFKLLSKNSF